MGKVFKKKKKSQIEKKEYQFDLVCAFEELFKGIGLQYAPRQYMRAHVRSFFNDAHIDGLLQFS